MGHRGEDWNNKNMYVYCIHIELILIVRLEIHICLIYVCTNVQYDKQLLIYSLYYCDKKEAPSHCHSSKLFNFTLIYTFMYIYMH